MYQYTLSKLLIASGAIALFSATILWSFNELSELFGGPQAQFRHAIAAIGILLVIKWFGTQFCGGRQQSSKNHGHFRNSRNNVHEH